MTIKKITILLIIVAVTSAVGFLSVPQKAKGEAVYVTGGHVNVTEIGAALQKQIATALNTTLINKFTGVSSFKDIWEKAYKLLSDSIRASIQKLLEQQLQTMTNDILGYIKDNDLIIKDFTEYYQEQTTQKQQEVAQDVKKENQKDTIDNVKLTSLKTIHQTILDKDPLVYGTYKDDRKCSFSDADVEQMKTNFTWDKYFELINQGGCIAPIAMMLAQENKLKEKSYIGDTAGTAAQLEMTSSGFKPGMGMAMIAGATPAGTQKQPQGTEVAHEQAHAGATAAPIDTPVSVIEEMAKMAATNPYKLAQQKNANLVNNLGTIVPYIQNLLTSFLKQLINQGMSTAMNALQGPSSSQPNASMPPNVADHPEEIYDVWAEQDLSAATSLRDQQKLLNENLTNQYLFQQQTTLNVLYQIQDLQKQTLLLLEEVYFASQATTTPILREKCSLPSWAEKSENGDLIKITAGTVGSITFNKNKEIIESVYQVAPRIDLMKKEIAPTQQKIADLNLAIAATENFIPLVKKYIDQPTDQTKTDALSARDSCIKLGQKPINSTAENLFQLDADTQGFNLMTVQKTYDLQSSRGFIEAPQNGTLYGEISDLNSKVADLNSALQTCQSLRRF